MFVLNWSTFLKNKLFFFYLQAFKNLIEIFEKKPNALIYMNVNSDIKKKLETLIAPDRITYCQTMKEIPECLLKKKNDYEATALLDKEPELMPRKMSYYDNV